MPRPPSWSTQPRRGRRVSAKRPLIAAIKRGAPRLRPHGLRDDATRHAGRVDVGPDDTPRGHRRGRGPGRGSARCTGLPSAASTTGAACPSDGPCSGPSSRIGHRSASSRVSTPPDCEVPSSGSHCECRLVRAVARTRGCTACVVACEGGATPGGRSRAALGTSGRGGTARHQLGDVGTRSERAVGGHGADQDGRLVARACAHGAVWWSSGARRKASYAWPEAGTAMEARKEGAQRTAPTGSCATGTLRPFLPT
jgi:hypothetical protein